MSSREEFKTQLNGIVDGIVDTNRELTEDDENNLVDHFGDVAQEILGDEDDDDVLEEGEESA